MRNLEKGQHIFIAFQDGKAVLDSQLRPRIYTSLKNADKWTPTVDKGKIEYVEYAPTLTPPNEWVSVEERLPEEKQRVIVRCERVGTSVGWILWGRWMTDIGPHAGDVTYWMPLPKSPKEDE